MNEPGDKPRQGYRVQRTHVVEYGMPFAAIDEVVFDMAEGWMTKVADARREEIRPDRRTVYHLTDSAIGPVGMVEVVTLGSDRTEVRFSPLAGTDKELNRDREKRITMVMAGVDNLVMDRLPPSEAILDSQGNSDAGDSLQLAVAGEVNAVTGVPEADVDSAAVKIPHVDELPTEEQEKIRLAKLARQYGVKAHTIEKWEKITARLRQGLARDDIAEALGLPIDTLRSDIRKMRRTGWYKEHIGPENS